MNQFINLNGNIYSIEMMIAYVNTYKPKSILLNTETLFPLLHLKVWGYKKYYSPFDVLKNPKKKLYQYDMQKINESDLKYPVMVDKTNFVDGWHRLAKAYLMNKQTIRAYEFDSKLMKKFFIGKRDKIKDADLRCYNVILLFNSRFDKK